MLYCSCVHQNIRSVREVKDEIKSENVNENSSVSEYDTPTDAEQNWKDKTSSIHCCLQSMFMRLRHKSSESEAVPLLHGAQITVYLYNVTHTQTHKTLRSWALAPEQCLTTKNQETEWHHKLPSSGEQLKEEEDD